MIVDNLVANLTHEPQRICRYWVALSVGALAISGIFALLVVLARIPSVHLPFKDFFDTALVIHVNLSVLVWMLSISVCIFSMFLDCYYILRFLYYVAAAGVLLIAISGFSSDPSPLKNNYLPILQHPVFSLGLGLFFASVLILSALMIFAKFKKNYLYLSALYTAITIIISAVCFAIAYRMTPMQMRYFGNIDFYEEIFWGGGHVLQFAFAQMLVAVWLLLVRQNSCSLLLPTINLLIVLPTPLFYLFDNNAEIFTWHMRWGGGVLPAVAAILIFKNIFKYANIESLSVVLSVTLFAYGGFLGFMISDTSIVTVPAHYHGSIVSITIAFMGFIYFLMPYIGFGKVNNTVAKAQIWTYSIGQTMHITGLALMGGYKMLRKTAGQDISGLVAKFFFISGSLIAMLGGLLFVALCFYKFRRKA
jgi:hypothetical protein